MQYEWKHGWLFWLIHTARDRDREMMGPYITLCTVHTTHWQAQGIIVFYCTHPIPCPSPGPVQCVYAMTAILCFIPPDWVKFLARRHSQPKKNLWTFMHNIYTNMEIGFSMGKR